MAPESSRLAIDLSGGLIRALEGVMGGNMRCGTAALPEGAWTAGRVMDPEAAGHSLKQLLARLEITESRAFVAVSDAMATFRVLDLAADASDSQVAAAIARELALDPERFANRWIEVAATDVNRMIYAAAWDRAAVKNVTDAARVAGVEPVVVELKSAAVARTVPEPSCILVDLVASPAEIILVDGHVPQVWHAFEVPSETSESLADVLAMQVRSVVRFHRRKRTSTFGPTSPVLISAEQLIPGQVLTDLSDTVGHPAQALAAPPRVPIGVRHPTYLACLGLIMRRES